MNYKLKKFWNPIKQFLFQDISLMNYKLKKFWNNISKAGSVFLIPMNYKLKKFWNWFETQLCYNIVWWTINLKSFEIKQNEVGNLKNNEWTINLKSFEIKLDA